MIIRPFIAAVGALLFAAAAFAAPPPAAAAKPRAVPVQMKEWKGDADGMIERRAIRMLVPFSRTLYFNDKGRERGLTAELARDLERFVNQKYRKELAKRPVTVVLIPTTRDKLIGGVAAGLGDIAAGDLTATDERRKAVDFLVPAESPRMSEIVLTGAKSPPVGTADDLSGKTVHVRKSSSYHESLAALNDRLKKAGKPAVNIVLVPDALEDEDMMEMLNVGMLQAIVVDDWLAKMWAPSLPAVKLNDGAVLRSAGQAGWAIRKGSPKLQALIGEFYAAAVKKANPIGARMAQQSRRIKLFRDATASEEYKRFQDTIGLFRTYGAKYGFDPLMLAAQGYQESQLNQSVKSRVGAIGIMQVMPATGAELKVGDVHVAENNVHAGAKYMDILMTRYFTDAKFDETNRSLFAFASYNAGPGGIARMRKLAASRGLDPDVWFNNVEIVTAEKIGMETPTYVRNIYKYYVSYRLMQDIADARKKAVESVKPGR